MTMRRWSWTSFLLTATLGLGAPLLACAGRRPATETAGSPRMKDSIPEKRAADRSAAGLGLEKEDERWGFDAARERKRREKTPPAPNNFPPPSTTTPPPAAPPASAP